MNYASLKQTDITDGPGVRVALFVSGCQLALDGHPCKGCHNYAAWSKDYGEPFTSEVEDKIIEYLKPDYIEGFSLLGGEPLSMFNVDREIKLLKRIRKEFGTKKTVWMWTGYRLNNWMKEHPDKCEIFDYIDVVIDGPFIQSLNELDLKYRGSTNQRVLDLNKFLKRSPLQFD